MTIRLVTAKTSQSKTRSKFENEVEIPGTIRARRRFRSDHTPHLCNQELSPSCFGIIIELRLVSF